MCYGLRAVQAAPGRQAAILDDQGQRVRAERPQIGIGANGEPLVVFRRFGKVEANAELGQPALTRLASNGSSPASMYLTDEGRQHWQQSVAINIPNDEAVVLSVGRSVPGGALAASIVSEIEPAAPNRASFAVLPNVGLMAPCLALRVCL